MQRNNTHINPLIREQVAHDMANHADIATLSIGRRQQHYVLHLAKYVGRSQNGLFLENVNVRMPTLVDTALICLSALSALCVTDVGAPTPCMTMHPLSAPAFFKADLAYRTGFLAKIAEDLDHGLPMNVHALAHHWCELLHSTLDAIAHDADPLEAIRNRRAAIVAAKKPKGY